ncbi:MAG: hypothetical protein ACHQUC_10395 [Chlamydiales bacterium]
MGDLSIGSFLNYSFDSFKEFSIKVLAALEERVIIIALVVFGLISSVSIYCLYRVYSQKNNITHLNQSKKENPAISRILPNQNRAPSVIDAALDKRADTEEEADAKIVTHVNQTDANQIPGAPRSYSETHIGRLVVTHRRTPLSPRIDSPLKYYRNSLQSVAVRRKIVFSQAEDEQGQKIGQKIDSLICLARDPKIGRQFGEETEQSIDAEQQIEQTGPVISSSDLVLHPCVETSSGVEKADFKTLWQEANILFQEDECEEAEKSFERALEMNPGAALTLSLRGYGALLCEMAVELAEAQQLDEANKKYQKALELNPNDFCTLRNYVDFLLNYKMSKIQDVQPLLKRILAANPLDEEALEMFIECFDENQPPLEDQKLIDRSEKAIRESKELNIVPDCLGNTLYEQGEILFKMTQFTESLPLKESQMRLALLKFKEAMKRDRDDDFAKWGYADALTGLALGFLAREIQIIEDLFTQNENSQYTEDQASTSSERMTGKRIFPAVYYSDKALKMVPRHPLAKLAFDKGHELATAFYHQKGRELEEDLYEKTRSLAGKEKENNTILLEEYGHSLFENGMYDQAFEIFNKILIINPNHDSVKKPLSKLREILEPLRDFDD